MKITTKASDRFCREDYGEQRCGRGPNKPEISAGTIFLLVVLMVASATVHLILLAFTLLGTYPACRSTDRRP